MTTNNKDATYSYLNCYKCDLLINCDVINRYVCFTCELEWFGCVEFYLIK